MVWVRSEYAGELAVVLGWLTALLPWSVTVIDTGNLGLFYLRFAAFRLRYVYRNELGVGVSHSFLWVFDAPGFQAIPELAKASYLWLAGAAVVALVVAFALVYYVAEERVERLRVDPVRVMGALIALAAVVFTASSALFLSEQSVTIPIGVAFMWAFAAVLLRVERT